MGIAERARNKSIGGILYPNEVKKILNSDTSEIKQLCKQVKVYPKKDHLTGKTFFMKDDVDFLKKIKDLNLRSYGTYQPPATISKPQQNQIVDNSAIIGEFQNAVEKLLANQESMVEKIQSSLENKLEGMDEVVVELIQSKTENEHLRIKINQLTKENYDLRNALETFKPVGFGFYSKQKENSL